MPVWSILGSVIRLCVRNSCGIRRGLLLGAGLAVVSGTAGCRSTPAYQGASHDVLATYHYRKLRSDLPGTIRVPAAIAAAESSLRSRGYAIRSSTSTEDRGRIEAALPDAGLFEEVVVLAEAIDASTRIEILIEPMGDQKRSRAIMDGILTRLGL